MDCPGHGLCCFDGCANTCYNQRLPQPETRKSAKKKSDSIFFETALNNINQTNVSYFNLSYFIASNAVPEDCSCNDHVGKNWYGRCRKVYKKGPVCYVNQPSTCKDLVHSTTEKGEQYSWDACEKSQGNIESKIEQYINLIS